MRRQPLRVIAAVVLLVLAAIAAGSASAASAEPKPAPTFLGGGVLISPPRAAEIEVGFRIPRVGCAHHVHAVVRIGVFGVVRHARPTSTGSRLSRWFAGAIVTCYRHRLSHYEVAYNGVSIGGAPPAPRDRVDVFVEARPCSGVQVGDRYTGSGVDVLCRRGTGLGTRVLVGARVSGAPPRAFTVPVTATVAGQPLAAGPFRLRPQVRNKTPLAAARGLRPRRAAFTVAVG